MKLDYKRFKKLHSDDKSTTLQHPDGHSICIAHHALSEENRKELDGVPMMAEGGEVPDYLSPDPIQSAEFGINAPVPQDETPEQANARLELRNQQAIPLWQQGAQKVGEALTSQMYGAPGSVPSGGAPEQAPSKPDVSNVSLGAPVAPRQAGAIPMPSGDMYAHGVQSMKAGLEGGARATQMQAEGELKAANEMIAKQQEMEQNYQNNYNELEQSRKDLMDDIKNGHIDPSHYMDSMSTGGKIATAIGLLMGGIGGGAMGQSNPAMDFLNKQIDRDIESQKANLGKKNTLLSATMQQFGNMRDAEQMARVYQTDIYKAKLEQAMASAKSPMAKAALQKAIGELEMTAGPIMQAQAQKRAVMAGMQSGAVQPAVAARMIIEDKHDKEQAFKEIANIENSTKSVQDLDHLAKKMDELQSLSGRARWGAESEINSLNTQVMGAMHSILGALSEGDKKLAESNKIYLTDPPNVRATKISVLKQLALKAGTSTPVLDSYGISMRKPSDAPKAPAPKGAVNRK